MSEEFDKLAVIRNKVGCTVHQIECEALYDAVIKGPEGVIVEVGSAYGGSTIYLVEAALKVGKMVISVDPYPVELEGSKQEIGWYSKGMCGVMKKSFKDNVLDKYPNVIQYNVDILHCIMRIPSGLSLIFIDGRHDGDYSCIDYEALFPKLRKGGTMAMHDMHWKDTYGKGVGCVSPRIKVPEYKDVHAVGCMKMGVKDVD